MKHVICTVVLASLAMVGTAAQAQDTDFSLGAGVSSLGVFVEPSFKLNDNWSVRAPVYYYHGTTTLKQDKNKVDSDVDALSASIVADYYPTSSGFFLSGGLAFGGYDVDGDTNQITANGNVYTGDFGVSMKPQKTVAPQISVGYRHATPGGMRAAFELGARFRRYEASVSGTETLPQQGQDDIADEVARANDDLDDFPVVPFLSVSFGWTF